MDKILYKAYQVDPALQESTWDNGAMLSGRGIVLAGNSRMRSYTNEACGVYDDNMDITDNLHELQAAFGEPYKHVTLQGISQSDWQGCYCPESTPKSVLSYIESCYFNTGTEWRIEPTRRPTEYFYMYTTLLYDKQELADELTGGNKAAIELYRFDGYTQTVRYAEAE